MRTETKFPLSQAIARPYRLWDCKAKAAMRWRYYSDARRAHVGAMIEAGWAKVGTSIQVYDATNGKLLGEYTRRLQSVQFTREE